MPPTRAQRFVYDSLEVRAHSLHATYRLDGERFSEEVTFDGDVDLRQPAPAALASLWFFAAGLSYYKAGAAHVVDLGDHPITPAGRLLLEAALHDGLGEFAYRNQLPLDDVSIIGGRDTMNIAYDGDAARVLTPFGGGIDSIVTVEALRARLDQSLFVVSPQSGRFAPLEAAAEVTELDIVRATRLIDPAITAKSPHHFQGHVPVTLMVTLLAAIAASAQGRGGVAMSNEHSASVPNLRWRDRDINHQWSKSWIGEQLISAAVGELVGNQLVVASYLRDRSELWVARQLAAHPEYWPVFRSCNRAFAQLADARLTQWCGTCDKCLFIHLVLAPFIPRAELARVLGVEPLADPTLAGALSALVGVGLDHKPFECVGDPDESSIALAAVVADPTWSGVAHLATIAREHAPERTLAELLEPQGPSRVPAHWR